MYIMNTSDTLLAYSEWLDADKRLVSLPGGDDNTHEDLVKEFIARWGDNPNRALLAGSTDYDDDPDLPEESDGKSDDKPSIAPSTREAIEVLTKLAKTSKEEDIRLQAAQTLLSYSHVVGS